MSKSKGDYRERKGLAVLKEMGATVRIRSAGSHGPFDLCGVFPDHVKLIQVKSDKYGITLAEKETLSKLDVAPDVQIEIWLYQHRKPFEIEILRSATPC